MQRQIRLLTVLGLVVATASGCTPPGQQTREDDALTVQLAAGPEERRVYESLVRAFEEEHPAIDVELVAIDQKEDHIARLHATLAAGTGPDVALLNFREYAQFAARGWLTAIEPLLRARGDDIEDFHAVSREAFTYDGALQCLPQNVSTAVIYYNARLFREAGVEPPGDSWTWAEFRRTAERLTGDGVRGFGMDPALVRVAPFVWSNGGEVVDDLERPTRFELDSVRSREALRFLLGMVDDRLVPTAREVATRDLETRFTAGQLAMLVESRRLTPRLNHAAEETGLDFDVAPLPYARRPATILHSDAYCLTRRARASSDAVTFVQFALGTLGQRITATDGRTVPSRSSIANSPAFLSPDHPPSRDRVFLDNIEVAKRLPILDNWPKIEDAANTTIERLFYEDGYELDEAMRDLDRRSRPMFADAGDDT